jgi:hypothetical protein
MTSLLKFASIMRTFNETEPQAPLDDRGESLVAFLYAG